jgi:hypothetical protein
MSIWVYPFSLSKCQAGRKLGHRRGRGSSHYSVQLPLYFTNRHDKITRQGSSKSHLEMDRASSSLSQHKTAQSMPTLKGPTTHSLAPAHAQVDSGIRSTCCERRFGDLVTWPGPGAGHGSFTIPFLHLSHGLYLVMSLPSLAMASLKERHFVGDGGAEAMSMSDGPQHGPNKKHPKLIRGLLRRRKKREKKKKKKKNRQPTPMSQLESDFMIWNPECLHTDRYMLRFCRACISASPKSRPQFHQTCF